jgi:hypothetical protein
MMETLKTIEEREQELVQTKMELAEALETIKYLKVEQQQLEKSVSEYRKDYYAEQQEKFKYKAAFSALVDELKK